MSEALQVASISAPGFMGLNTQDSPTDLNAGFALIATNCIVDKFGRIGSRKGWEKVNSASGDLGANDVEAIHELIDSAGNATILFAGGNKLFRLSSTNTVQQLTYGGGGTAPTITANTWQIVSLNGAAYFFQTGHAPLIYDPTISTTTYRRISEKTGYTGTVQPANVALAAFGRLWVANTVTNKSTVWFSDLLAGHVWSTGTSGSLNVDRVWPNGADEIQGLAAHNNFLIIFGKTQILVYQEATTPATMSLSDTVGGIGCIARDTIQTAGKDVLFLSNSGLRSFARTIIEKSAPLGDLSKNVRNDLVEIVSNQSLANVKSVYSEKEAFYLLNLPATKSVYCFDTRQQLQDGAYRVTMWDSIDPTAMLSRRNGDLLIGKNSYIGKYTGYQDNSASYRMMYYTNHADLGSANVTSIPKRLKTLVIGGSAQTVVIKWGFDLSSNYRSSDTYISKQGISEYGIAEYGANATTIAEYSSGILMQTLSVPLSGSGKLVQVGFETDIKGSSLSIQRFDIHHKDGKLS